MRRFIAYSTLAATMLIAVAVSVTPAFKQINSGNEFASGHEVTFKVTEKGDNTQITYSDVDDIVTEMRSRLENLDIEDYTVNVQRVGNNHAEDLTSQYITVSMSCEKSLFNEACRYLSFSGQNFSFSTSYDNEKFNDNVIKNNEAYIAQYNDIAPLIVIPLTDEGKNVIEDYIKNAHESEGTNDGTTKSSIKRDLQVHAHDEDGNPTEDEQNTKQADIFLWGNHDDFAEENIETAKLDPYIGNKLILGFSHEDIYLTSQEAQSCGILNYEEKSAIRYYVNLQSASEIRNANIQANLYLGMLKAKEYKYEITCPTVNVTESGFDYYTNSLSISATSEELFVTRKNKLVLNAGALIITGISVMVIVAVALAIYYRLSSIAVIATTLSSLFLTFLSFVGLGATFNIPAILGVVIIAVGSLFSEIFYLTKFKEEVLKGRNFKKANQEASKKSNLITLDVAVVSMIAGLMSYLLGGVSLKPLGVVLFFGGFITLVMNLVIFKLLMNLLTNTTALQNNYKAYNINESLVPNLMAEEKPTYVAPFEKINFTKPKKLAGLILAGLTTLSLAGVLIFGIADKSPLNVKQATKDTAVIYTQFEKDEGTTVDSIIKFKEHALSGVTVDSEEIPLKNIEMSEVSTYIYDSEKPETETKYYFTIKLDKSLSFVDISNMKLLINDNLETQNIYNAEIDILNSKQLIYTPNQGLVALATGISILAVTVYYALRFRPSRGLAAGCIVTATTLTTYGLISLLRIGTTAVTSLTMPFVAFTGILGSLLYFVIEKSVFKENNEELTPELREKLTKKALGKFALPFLTFNILLVYITIHLFGFGLKTTTALFGVSLFGELITIASIAILLAPLSEYFAKLFGKINLPKLKKEKKVAQFEAKQKSSEPEETIFIGIND